METGRGKNPVQGKFQVVRFSLDGLPQIYAAEISGTQPLPLTFPPEDEEDLDWLMSNIVDAYQQSLDQAVQTAIEEGKLQTLLSGDKVLLGDIYVLCGDEQEIYLETIFDELHPGTSCLYTEKIMANLRALGCLMDVPVMRSKVAQEMGEDDSTEIEMYDEFELEPEAQMALEEMGEEAAGQAFSKSACH